MQSENNRRFEEKSHENRQLMTQLETLREESARQVAKVKDRCDTVKTSMQAQINDMETELIQSRATLCVAKKDKDEVHTFYVNIVLILFFNFLIQWVLFILIVDNFIKWLMLSLFQRPDRRYSKTLNILHLLESQLSLLLSF